MWWLMLIISVTARIIKQEDRGSGMPGQKQDPTSKIIITKKAGGVAQAAEHVPTKCRFLTSNTSNNK
jgi:hypothetical protein